MSEINIKLIAEQLGKDIENISEQTQKAIQTAIEQLSLNAYNEAQRLAMQRLNTTRENYLNSLKYEKLEDNLYVVYLDPNNAQANHTESGYSGFDLKPGLLNGPKSRKTKTGRMNIIPLASQPYSKQPTSRQIVTDIRSAIKKIEKDKSISKITKDINQGKMTTYKGKVPGIISGLTKITKQYKKTQQSTYLLFRAVSSNSDPSSWIHSGYSGCHVFRDVEKFVKENIDKIIKSIL